MKDLSIDWDERRYQIVLNLTKNVTISQISGMPHREIEVVADELINYLKEKSKEDSGVSVYKIRKAIEDIMKSSEEKANNKDLPLIEQIRCSEGLDLCKNLLEMFK